MYDLPTNSHTNAIVESINKANRSYHTVEAVRRAEALLRANLSPEQLTDWETTRSFVVTAPGSGNQYRITRGSAHNVFFEAGHSPIYLKRGASLCGFPTTSGSEFQNHLPFEDIALGQKLLLESPGGEGEFLRTAVVGRASFYRARVLDDGVDTYVVRYQTL